MVTKGNLRIAAISLLLVSIAPGLSAAATQKTDHGTPVGPRVKPADLAILPPTNLTVVRHEDNTIWAMSCHGTSAADCTEWSQITGGFTVQPTLTWDPTIRKFLLVGIGNNRTSIWRSTFEPSGTWNADWTLITGASPSPVAVAGGPIPGPTYETIEMNPGAFTMPAVFSDGSPLCWSADVTPTVAQVVKLDASTSASAAAANTFTSTLAYSTDAGATWQWINAFWAPATIPAGGWATSPLVATMELTAGVTYSFALLPQTAGGSAFAVTASRCHLNVTLTDK
jgi:hypothetical protein